MRWSFLTRETWKYRKLVQRRFWKASGILDHEFAILDPGHWPWTYVTGTRSEESAIPEGVSCVHHKAGAFTIVLIPKREFPNVSEAILLLREAQSSGSRIGRYMTMYQAYESIVANRDRSLSAIRHALSHASSALTRKSTVDELAQIFGSTQIDFSIYRHLREFNVHLGRLLIATDNALEQIVAHQAGFIKSTPVTEEALDAA